MARNLIFWFWGSEDPYNPTNDKQTRAFGTGGKNFVYADVYTVTENSDAGLHLPPASDPNAIFKTFINMSASERSTS